MKSTAKSDSSDIMKKFIKTPPFEEDTKRISVVKTEEKGVITCRIVAAEDIGPWEVIASATPLMLIPKQEDDDYRRFMLNNSAIVARVLGLYKVSLLISRM